MYLLQIRQSIIWSFKRLDYSVQYCILSTENLPINQSFNHSMKKLDYFVQCFRLSSENSWSPLHVTAIFTNMYSRSTEDNPNYLLLYLLKTACIHDQRHLEFHNGHCCLLKTVGMSLLSTENSLSAKYATAIYWRLLESNNWSLLSYEDSLNSLLATVIYWRLLESTSCQVATHWRQFKFKTCHCSLLATIWDYHLPLLYLLKTVGAISCLCYLLKIA